MRVVREVHNSFHQEVQFLTLDQHSDMEDHNHNEVVNEEQSKGEVTDLRTCYHLVANHQFEGDYEHHQTEGRERAYLK